MDEVGPVSATAVRAPVRDPESVELLRRVADGDAAAVGGLYDRFVADVLGMAMRVTRDRVLAEDVVQETFLAIWRNAAQYRDDLAQPRTWILTIARYRAIDLLRRRSKNPAGELLPDAPDLPRVPDVWGDVSARLDRAAIRSAVEKLPDVQRHAIELAYFGGLTQLEIAAVTRTPLGTVKSRVRLGLLALRSHLEAAEAGFLGRPADVGPVVPMRLTVSTAA
jgi:RNA polymerase sigma-70 factor, ECF subfamily